MANANERTNAVENANTSTGTGAVASRRPTLAAGGRSIARSLSIEPGEEMRTALLFVLLFVGSMIFVMGRTARDALFLTKFPVTWIAYMWVGYGVVSSIVAVGYSKIAPSMGRERLVIGFTLGAAISYAVVRVLIGADIAWAYAFFYIWAEVMANLIIVQAWTITNDLHDPRSAKRLFGVIGAGRILGILISGFVTGAIVRWIGTANLIVVVIGFMGLFVVLVRLIGSRYALPKKPVRAAAQASPAVAQQALQRSQTGQYRGYTLALSALLLLAFVVLTVGDYQFKAIAKIAYPKRDDLAAYMAGFYAAVGALAFVFQVFVTPRILKKLGVIAGLLTMPIAFLAGTTGVFFAPVLATGTAMKLSDNGLQYTIHDATFQLLYFAFPPDVRTRVRAMLDAAVKPLGYSLGGVALVLLSPVPFPGESAAHLAARVGHVGWLSLVLGFAWILLAPVVRRRYVDSLRVSLVRRQSDASDEAELPYDATMRHVLLDALRSGEPAQVAYASERLADADPETLQAELGGLLGHQSPEVRALALRRAAQLRDARTAQWARLALRDEDPRVCAAAVEALGIVCPDDAIDEIEGFVADDAKPVLRDAAIGTLIASAGLQGVLLGGAKLQAMVRSSEPADRAAAADIFGSVGQPALARSLRPLFKDPDRHVRRAAVTAASRCVSPLLIGPLLEALPERPLIKPAVRALAALGPSAVPELGRRLTDTATPRLGRLNTPRVLARIGTPQALEVLLGHMGDADEGVRQKVLASASRLHEALRTPPVPAAKLRPHIQNEIKEHVALRDAYAAARPWVARPLLDAQIAWELRGNIVRIMRMCELGYSKAHVAAARHAIFSKNAAQRANALEVLDNVLDNEIRGAILAALDRFGPATAFEAVPKPPDAPVSAEAKTWIETRAQLPGHYRRSLVFEAIGVRRLVSLAPMAFRHLEAVNPFMRENALIALAACRPDGWREAMQRGADADACPIVRTYARYVIERDSDGLDPEDDMYTTIEKILFLQGVPLFASVPGNELMPLARSATIVRMPAGATLFKQGDPGDALYVVVHGKVGIVRDGKTIASLGPGEVFGEMAILDQETRSTDVVVETDADLLHVSVDDFNTALEDTAEIASGVIRVLSQRIREMTKKAEVVKTDEHGRRTVM